MLLKHTLGSSDKLKSCQGQYETMERLRALSPKIMQETFLVQEVRCWGRVWGPSAAQLAAAAGLGCPWVGRAGVVPKMLGFGVAPALGGCPPPCPGGWGAELAPSLSGEMLMARVCPPRRSSSCR